MKTTETINLFHSGSNLSIPTVVLKPFFATVRIKKDSKQILDGRIYKTESAMLKHRATRPARAVCIKINMRLPHGMIECEMVTA